MENINLVSVVLYGAFILPLLIGFARNFSRERIQYSLGSLLDNIEFLISLLVAVFLTKKIFFENTDGIFKSIYGILPEGVRSFFYGHDVLTYIIVVPIILLVVILLLRLITTPLYTLIVVPTSNRLYARFSSMGNGVKRVMGAMWQLPKSIYLPLIAALVLNFYTYYFYTPELSKWMNESSAYQFLYDRAIYPVLNSNIAKQIPVLVNDSFGEMFGRVIPREGDSIARKLEEISGGKIKVIQYFNGVTLDEAIRSKAEIDELAAELTAAEDTDTEKAYELYRWISSNINYDYDKAESIVDDASNTASGSIEAFDTGTGICFDYSCLYISMSRAVGLKVRLITGLGYSGISWGDHAWNQVYSSEEARWIDLDTTFGSTGVNYFDKTDFQVDHQYSEIQGEW